MLHALSARRIIVLVQEHDTIEKKSLATTFCGMSFEDLFDLLSLFTADALSARRVTYHTAVRTWYDTIYVKKQLANMV